MDVNVVADMVIKIATTAGLIAIVLACLALLILLWN